MDSTMRFSDRVGDYVKFRPHYPEQVVQTLQSQYSLRQDQMIVDVGSGTGISSELFLKNGYQVWGVEPNDLMRQESDSILKSFTTFHSVKGVSHETTLPSQFADLILVAQAFHWFDPVLTKIEFSRILKKQGHVAILFNDRATKGSAFAESYEALLQEFGSDYKLVKHKNVGEKRHHDFLGHYDEYHFPNFQDFNFEGLLGRLKSSSYAPKEGHVRFPEMVQNLKQIFNQNQINGIVRMHYDTQLFVSKKFN